jgi:hypothetical protein
MARRVGRIARRVIGDNVGGHCHAASGLRSRWRFCSQGDEENAILRWEPFDFEQFEERGGIGFHETQFMRQIGGVDMAEYLVVCLDMRHMRCIRVGKQDDAMELNERVNHWLHARLLAEMAAPYLEEMGICLIEAMVGCESRVQVLDAEPTGAYFGFIQANRQMRPCRRRV